jgi:uncharacterized protein (TIGR02757 family)
VLLGFAELKQLVHICDLKETLDSIGVPEHLNDPVRYVRRFRSREDAEIVGLLVSAIAYGKIVHIMRDTLQLLEIIGDRPARFVAGFKDDWAPRFDRFRHRFTRSTHVACMISRMKCALDDYGSLHALFLEGWDESGDMRSALSHFARRLCSYPCPGFCDDCRTPDRRSVRWLISEPRTGSAAKRMCLYVRWMVRAGYPDIGVWNGIPPSALVIPLDTHVARIGRLLGLTRRRASDWLTAVEVTGALKQLDPDDPLRYDYSLSHLGIDGGCSGRFDRATCVKCAVKRFCAVTRQPKKQSSGRNADGVFSARRVVA